MKSTFALVLTATLAAGAAHAQAGQTSQPAVVSGVVDCRTVADAAARLACYDRAAGALDDAQRTGAVVVVDREEVRANERRNFGFSLPSFSLPSFGSGDDGGVDSVASTLVEARPSGIDNWQFYLADGSIWRKSDEQDLRQTLTPGMPANVRRAAFNSYMIDFGGGRSIRVNRIR